MSSFVGNATPVVQLAPLDGDSYDDVAVLRANTRLVTLAGDDGAAVATFDAPAGGQLMNAIPDDESAAQALSIVVADENACNALAYRFYPGSGTAQLVRTTSAARQPAEWKVNLVSLQATDFDDDGVIDPVIEGRAANDTRLWNVTAQYTNDGRDATPGVAMRGWVSVASSAGEVRIEKPASLGAGPLAGVFQRTGGPALAAMLDASANADGTFRTNVVARDRTGELWRVAVDALPQPVKFMDVEAGPCFVTFASSAAELVEGVFAPSPLGDAMRISALDRSTGALRWTKDWPGPVIPNVYPLDGDVLVDDIGRGELTRLSGGSGAVVWTTPYTATGIVHRGLAGDQTGDGFTDFLIPDTTKGAVVYSGSDGGVALRPLATLGNVGPSSLVPVADIDADGVDDIVAVIGTAPGEHVITAFAGGSGDLLWASPVDAVEGQGTAAAGHLRSHTLRDVVVLRGSRLVALDGDSGAVLWQKDV